MRLSQGVVMSENVNGTALDGYSVTGGFISNPVSLKHVYGYSVSVSWSGNPSGTFQLEGCNDIESPTDYAPFYPSLFNWVLIANSAQLASAGAAIAPATNPCLIWNIPDAMYRFVRLHYVYTSGTMQVSARLQMKAGE